VLVGLALALARRPRPRPRPRPTTPTSQATQLLLLQANVPWPQLLLVINSPLLQLAVITRGISSFLLIILNIRIKMLME
jgi:hypothetical protein